MRPFRQLPWVQNSAWMQKGHHTDMAATENDPEAVRCETGEPADGILNETVSPSVTAWTFGILALACVTLFSLAWLGKLP